MFEGLRDAFEYVTGLKEESMKYIQSIDLPFVLRRKKEGKKKCSSSLQI